jgi:hypothetical protein
MSANPSKSQRTIELGETLLGKLLDLEQLGSSAPLSLPQIRSMRKMIQDRITLVANSQLPPKNMRYNYLLREIVDSWPLGLPLAKLICEFEELYNNL